MESHWIQGEGNQVVAASKVRQKAEKGVRMGAVRQGGRMWDGERPVGTAVHVGSGKILKSC